MTAQDQAGKPDVRLQRCLEVSVPLLSFGSTIAGIMLWQAGFNLNYQFFSAGCILSSCILAYLAWIRPRKDIVALTTPVYAFIFFAVPAEDMSWVVLQLLYAASITILLFRLKARFGSSAVPQAGLSPAGPLGMYLERLKTAFPYVTGEHAQDAGAVFIRFARGEYHEAARLAGESRERLEGVSVAGPLTVAYSVIAEQAVHTGPGLSPPDQYTAFAPEHFQYLNHPPADGMDREHAYNVTLYNALLLLYAVAANGSDNGYDRLYPYREFAAKLVTLN